jgi:hypothetical protein
MDSASEFVDSASFSSMWPTRLHLALSRLVSLP